jgi:hypothetical protein
MVRESLHVLGTIFLDKRLYRSQLRMRILGFAMPARPTPTTARVKRLRPRHAMRSLFAGRESGRTHRCRSAITGFAARWGERLDVSDDLKTEYDTHGGGDGTLGTSTIHATRMFSPPRPVAARKLLLTYGGEA